MSNDDHERLISVTRRWERACAEKDVEIAELKKRVVYAETEVDRLKGEVMRAADLRPRREENARLRTALQKEYERHRRAVTIGGVPIEWCAACTKKRYPCAVREELGVVLGGGNE